MAEYEKITDIWPRPPTNLADRLKHVLDIWDDHPDDFIILIATSEVYGRHVRTGVTLGDLRELYGRERLGAETVLYGGSAAERLRDRLREDIAEHGPPPGTQPGDPNQP